MFPAGGCRSRSQTEARNREYVMSFPLPRFGRLLPLAALALCLLSLAAPARAESSLERLRRQGVLTIGTDATYPPFELKVGDKFEGFDIDLGNEIARELGVRAQFTNINWD